MVDRVSGGLDVCLQGREISGGEESLSEGKSVASG
jgi:hypothetical protein